MDHIALYLLLGFACNALGRQNYEEVSSSEMAQKINTVDAGWKATVYGQFAGMDWEDAKKMLGSYGPWPENSPPQLVKQYLNSSDSVIPETFDARLKWPDSIHPIQNQGICGSCWAFATSGVLSDRFAIACDRETDEVLSAQQLVDCNTANDGCNGGWPYLAWLYMTQVGLLTKQCYGPYTAVTGTCKFSGTAITQCPSGNGEHRFSKAAYAYAVAPTVEAIQREIMTNGPVTATFAVYQDFFSYLSGVYSYTTGEYVWGHAIKILRWGRSPQGIDYWICANSWGTNWGITGYFYIRRGTNEVGIESGVTAGTVPAANCE